MEQNSGTRDREPAIDPSPIGRLINYRQVHGSLGLLRRLAEIGHRTVLKQAALATYYPSIGLEIARWKLRPRETVIRTLAGTRRFDSGRFAVFLVYQPKATPWYVENALRALAEARINVLLVFNHDLDDERMAWFRARSFGVMIRDNTGLDIGGYRDGYLAIREEPGLERLLLLNDSVYFFERGLTEFFDRLISSHADLCAPYENRQFHYHVQSFCLSLSAAMLRNPTVSRFFESYVPVNSRRWAIHQGELGLSRALTGATDSIEVLYSAEGLVQYGEPIPDALRDSPSLFLPILLRRRFEWLRAQPGGASSPPLAMIARLAGSHSQIHTAGFVFRVLFGAPLIKRDLVYREQFSVEDLHQLLPVIGDEGHGDEIVADLSRKGVGSELRGLERGRYVAGMI